jgi:hypothetical protein
MKSTFKSNLNGTTQVSLARMGYRLVKSEGLREAWGKPIGFNLLLLEIKETGPDHPAGTNLALWFKSYVEPMKFHIWAERLVQPFSESVSFVEQIMYAEGQLLAEGVCHGSQRQANFSFLSGDELADLTV